ncbi:MAG: amidohydrolase family protein [Caldilineaceae bacterium]|nr:amidohydrolase family protein [Caldilineaceae bacterium]
MPTDLALHIQETRLVDTHEHLRKEAEYVEQGPDLLQSLFQNYVAADLVVAGASQAAVDALVDGSNPDLRARFAGVQQAWAAVRHTGYGEAVRLIAQLLYDLDDLTPDTLEQAQATHDHLRQPGERLRLLREVAHLDHVQIDDFVRPCLPDASGPDFFFYDISWVAFCNGTPDLEPLAQETGVAVKDLATLKEAMHRAFEMNASVAIAVKSQHAYNRTLQWRERTDAEAEQALSRYLRDPQASDEADRLCLGDWCWARGVELCMDYDLPFKLHTGYYAGHSRMPVERIAAGHLAPLLARYPQARFVLMHIAYPYSDELVALAKHYPNVYADLCWAWSIDPYSASHFVRRFLHAAPANKLFAFGGDTSWPTAAVAYAHQARRRLTHTLQAEVDEGWLREDEAMALATRVMRENQYACFRVAEKQQTLRRAQPALGERA